MTEPTSAQRVLASLVRVGDAVQLLDGDDVLLLDALSPPSLAWLARLSSPLLVEADVVAVSEGRRVVALGHPHPHPKLATLRAVEDQRYGAALESLASLGGGVVRDLDLLIARARSYAGVGRAPEAHADFERICAHVDARPVVIGRAFTSLHSAAAMAPAAASRINELLVAEPSAEVLPLLQSVRLPLTLWSPEVLLRGVGELLAGKALADSDLAEARSYVTAARALDADSARLADCEGHIAAAASKLAAREKKRARDLLASCPDFDDVERLFDTTLPPRLRQAWQAHYAGTTIGFGFFPAHKDKLAKLVELARKLVRDMPPELAQPASTRAQPVLPFAIGEHEDEYFVLDLRRPTGDGDFAVLVLFRGRGEGWVAYPSSREWIAGDGVTPYD